MHTTNPPPPPSLSLMFKLFIIIFQIKKSFQIIPDEESRAVKLISEYFLISYNKSKSLIHGIKQNFDFNFSSFYYNLKPSNKTLKLLTNANEDPLDFFSVLFIFLTSPMPVQGVIRNLVVDKICSHLISFSFDIVKHLIEDILNNYPDGLLSLSDNLSSLIKNFGEIHSHKIKDVNDRCTNIYYQSALYIESIKESIKFNFLNLDEHLHAILQSKAKELVKFDVWTSLFEIFYVLLSFTKSYYSEINTSILNHFKTLFYCLGHLIEETNKSDHDIESKYILIISQMSKVYIY